MPNGTAELTQLSAGVRARAPAATGVGARQRSNRWLVFGLPCLLMAAWLVGRSGAYEPGSQLGYRLGATGGIMLLLLFLYPLRKHLPLMRDWGPTRHWFALHMLLGILGPVLILMHSTFRVGSINAAVALTCMLLVAASGVVGRFIYTRIHHGLYGERARLQDLQRQLEGSVRELERALRGLPEIEAGLRAFQTQALHRPASLAGRAWSFLLVSVRGSLVRARWLRALRRSLALEARQRRWGDHELRLHLALATELIDDYVASIVRLARFATWERLFAWWHVLHVPLVYMLVLSAVAHVVAVHIY
jgi:hypothetical protein